MKAISLKQPFANFILFGWKTLETRTWNTNHRGPLLICVSKAIHDGNCFLDDREHDCVDVIRQWWKQEIPLHLGKALCVVDVTGCRDMAPGDEAAACCPLYPKAKAWSLQHVRPVRPFAVTGQLSFFDVDDKLLQYLRRCRLCACHDFDCRRCIERTGRPCTWVEEDLCSACLADMIEPHNS